jgi:hypothetical protein
MIKTQYSNKSNQRRAERAAAAKAERRKAAPKP